MDWQQLTLVICIPAQCALQLQQPLRVGLQICCPLHWCSPADLHLRLQGPGICDFCEPQSGTLVPRKNST